MQRLAWTIITCLTGLSISANLWAQGCSDAGFCTMGAMRPDQAYSKKINPKLRALEANFYRGTSLLSPVIYVATLDMVVGLNDKNYVQVKVPYQYTEGSLGSLGSIGDISLSYTRTLRSTQKWLVAGTLGTKIPSNDGNLKVSNEFTNNIAQPLHAYYQTSLGTYDAIAGVSMINTKWLFATGIQIPLTENNNEFLWGKFPSYPNQEYLRKYNRGVHLKRGTDVMLRVERNWRFTNYNFSLGLLPIYRITQDEWENPQTGAREKMGKETTGLAMSLLGSFGYQLDVNNKLKFIYGHKLTQRELNPDGLTRHNVISMSYIYQF
jgi:hypothetical protein